MKFNTRLQGSNAESVYYADIHVKQPALLEGQLYQYIWYSLVILGMIGLIYKLTKLKLRRLEKECHLCHYLEQNYQNNVQDIKNSGVRKEEDAISVADV